MPIDRLSLRQARAAALTLVARPASAPRAETLADAGWDAGAGEVTGGRLNACRCRLGSLRFVGTFAGVGWVACGVGTLVGQYLAQKSAMAASVGKTMKTDLPCAFL
ncbi:MAG: hypothetical protein KatS3mg082_1451 [Nitrospiraceae bacterium]|nr:MAG: hypothetical protein KatS3mg082_1451 [Nitrospiraceae bacterium]